MTLSPDIAKKLRDDLSESTEQLMWADREVIKQLSRVIEVDWDPEDFMGFMIVMSSIWSQAKEHDEMIMYNALHMKSLQALALGLEMRDRMVE